MFADAQKMLNKIISGKLLQANGVVSFYRANSVGDDIELYDNNGELLTKLYGLRQQVRHSNHRSRDGCFDLKISIFIII